MEDGSNNSISCHVSRSPNRVILVSCLQFKKNLSHDTFSDHHTSTIIIVSSSDNKRWLINSIYLCFQRKKQTNENALVQHNSELSCWKTCNYWVNDMIHAAQQILSWPTYRQYFYWYWSQFSPISSVYDPRHLCSRDRVVTGACSNRNQPR